MSLYLARVVQRDGVARYLSRGRLVDLSSNATHYGAPSAARVAIDRFLAKRPGLIADVIDANDPERRVA